MGVRSPTEDKNKLEISHFDCASQFQTIKSLLPSYLKIIANASELPENERPFSQTPPNPWEGHKMWCLIRVYSVCLQDFSSKIG